MRWLTRVAIAATILAFLTFSQPTGTTAHSDPNPAPNGVSPWASSESWTLTSSYGGLGHCHYLQLDDPINPLGCKSSGLHVNAYYALDLAKGSDPEACNRPITPIWDDMKVENKNNSTGWLLMTRTFGGTKYQLEYLHLNSIMVDIGNSVGSTTVVGKTGDKGDAFGCHLHLVVRRHKVDHWHSAPPTICGITYPPAKVGQSFKGCSAGDGKNPVAEANGPYPGMVGQPITFSASGSHDPDGTIDSYAWDWTSDGTYDATTGSQTIQHTYWSPYSGPVTLMVTDNDGKTATDTAPVSVLGNRPPKADANGDINKEYHTNEGTNWPLDGTGSSDPDGDALTYAWDLDDDGFFDDSTSATPTFTMVGQDGNFAVHLRVSDGEFTAEDGATVVVSNVPPSVTLSSDAPVDEGSAVTVSGTVTDPGWLDPLLAEIYWGDGTPPEPVGGVLENVRPDATLTFSVSHVYGDNGVFTAEVCAHDDDTTTCETIDLQVDNVDPTAEIDEAGAIAVNGIPTFFSRIGEPLNMSGRSTDPGSDDLYLSWDWDDGSPVVTTTYLVNPPNLDPYPSPSIQPRDVTDTQGHTYGAACLYQVKFWAEDDDGGISPVDTANVIIVGNADEARSAGYWQHQFGSHLTGRGHSDFDQATLECYLAISGYMSQVFDEETDASTFDLAHDVLFVKQNKGDMDQLLDRQLLGVWLNFANGSVEYDELVDTDGDGVADTVFLDAVAAAEAVRLDPSATREQMEEQKDILERLNLRDS